MLEKAILNRMKISTFSGRIAALAGVLSLTLGLSDLARAQQVPPRVPQAIGAAEAAAQLQTIRNAAPVPAGAGAAAATAPRPPGTSQPGAGGVPKNEFQEFVTASAGRELPIFGFKLFEDSPSTFAPIDNIPVTADYTVGPGDELVIRAWGQVDIDYRAVVDRNGTINIPKVGPIAVAGIKYQDLNNHVRTAVARNFRNFELMVTMGQLRSIQIFVVGNAKRPGVYTLSSLSTLVNALFAVGGPSDRGSMRSIQLKRGNRVVTEFDVYDLLVKGDKSKDVPLLPGDVLFFPPVGPMAAIAGSVQNPGIFELKGATSTKDLLGLAGGLTPTAQAQRVTIERIDNRKSRVVDQFSIDEGGLARTIKDGDLVSILAVSPRFTNAVTLRGHVAMPLRFPHFRGMRVRDLIPERDALITLDYYRRQNQATSVTALARGALAEGVRNLAGEINWDYAVIERQNKDDLSTTLIPFDLGQAVLSGDGANNLVLEPGDIVTVFSKADVTASVGRRPVVVTLAGEFKHSGVYQARPGETLRQLTLRAGGLSPNAYLFGAELTRESTREQQDKNYQETLNRLERDAEAQAQTRSQNVLTPEDAQSLSAQALAQRALIARLRSIKPTGRIVLEIPPLAKLADIPDVPLEDGDRLFVPPTPSMVNVFGAVFSEASFLYRPEKRVSDYLSQAGGTTRRADAGQIFMLRADGSVIGSSAGGGWFGNRVSGESVMPGDTIVVPEDLERTTFTRTLKDWTQILYQFGLGAAALKVLKQ